MQRDGVLRYVKGSAPRPVAHRAKSVQATPELSSSLDETRGSLSGTSPVGFNVAPAGGATNNTEIRNTLIDSNTTGISVTGPGTVVLSASVVTGQPMAISVSGGGQVISYGNKVIRNAGTPISTLPLQ